MRPFADRRKQALEAGPIDAAARATQIIVDDLDRCRTELRGMIGEPILPAPALVTVHELIGRRLTDIDACAAREMVSRDLVIVGPPVSSAVATPSSSAFTSVASPIFSAGASSKRGSSSSSRLGWGFPNWRAISVSHHP